MWYVEIIESLTGEVVKRIECSSERNVTLRKLKMVSQLTLIGKNYETRIVF